MVAGRKWRQVVVGICVGLVCLVCVGCAKQPILEDPTPPLSQGAVEVSLQLEPGVYRVDTGERVSREVLLDELARARFVVLGETHDDRFHHRMQREVYEALTRRAKARGGRVLLGMEMFQVPFQNVLDAYVAGSMEQAQMLEQTEWQERWRFPVEFYEALWQGARRQAWPVVALNAPREVTRRISQVGVEALTPDERAQVASELDVNNRAHREWFEAMFASHGMAMEDREAFERFYTAQVSWDETMAQSAVEAMEGAASGDQMVIVAGSGHVLNRWGIPSRIERRAPAQSVVTLIPVSAPGKVMTSLKGPTGATRQDMESWQATRFADFVWVE